MTKLHWYVTSGFGVLLAGSLAVTGCGDSDSKGSSGSGGAAGSDATGGETSSGGTGEDGTGGTGDAGSPGAAGDTGSSACTVTPPSTWSAPDWETNAAPALELVNRLPALTGAALMQGAEAGTLVDPLELSDLTAAFEAGDPSLSDAATEYFRGVANTSFGDFVAAIEAGAQDLVDEEGEWDPGADGGIWSTPARAFNTGGLEIRQVVDKGAFGGLFYGYAVGLTTGPIDEATIDAIVAAFGANSGLNPGRSNDPDEEKRNRFSANYLFQMGLYGEARQALIDAKAYAQDDDCAVERDAALVHFFRTWELGLFARHIFYSNAGAKDVAAASSADDVPAALQAALHKQAEGVGLALGLYGLPDPTSGPLAGAARLMSDDDVAAALAPLGIDVESPLADATLGEFVSDPEGYADAVTEVEDAIADVFGLTPQDVEAFRNPPADGG